MKKRVLSVLVAMCVMSMVLTGCEQVIEINGEDVMSVADEIKEQIEESMVVESEEASSETVVEESSEEVVEESSEEVVEESSKEVTQEATEELTVTVTEEATEEPSEEVVEIDTTDLAKAYEGYLEKEDIISKNVKCIATTSSDEMTIEMILASVNDDFQIGYFFPAAAIDLYSVNQKVYCRYELQGQKGWIWAAADSEEDAESLEGMADTQIIPMDDIHSYAYSETVEENGVVYDLILAETHSGEATYYVNRETQKLAKVVMSEEGQEMFFNIEEIESIEIPDEAKDATEGTVEEVIGYLMAVIFSSASLGE